MDVAVDHIQEETLSPDTEIPTTDDGAPETRPRAASSDLGTEFKEAYQALSSSVWGTRLGGFFGEVRKQGESYYEGARKELDEVTAEASKGWSGLVKQTQALSTQAAQAMPAIPATSAKTDPALDPETTPRASDADYNQPPPPDFLKETSQLVSRFKTQGAARLKQIQAAEDAADDALERFGTNVASWFKDAVSIAPPSTDDSKTTEILFESKDAEGKRIVHATRFDAQLHVIHSSPRSFLSDPDSPEYAPWRSTFDIEAKTDAVKKDLERYEELRRAMEKLVPEQVPYAEFWARYYFLRHVIESEEQKRRDLLKGSQADVEEVAWDDDEDDDAERSDTPAPKVEVEKQSVSDKVAESGSGTPTMGPTEQSNRDQDLLKPNEPRRSNEHSIADSDASYDLVSGAPSRGPESPKEEKSKSGAESDEEPDWE